MPPANKRRVLVIEDDQAVRTLIVDSLRENGLDVIAAVDGLHALRTALAIPPSAIVLDLGLPGMDGEDFIERWREREPREPRVPIVIVSGRADAGMVGAGLGARRVFGKPFLVDDLVSEVGRALS